MNRVTKIVKLINLKENQKVSSTSLVEKNIEEDAEKAEEINEN